MKRLPLFLFVAAVFLSLAAFPLTALAQTAVTDPPDMTVLIQQALAAFGDFKGGALIAGLVVIVNLLTNLTKLPFLAQFVNPKARPFISVGLGAVTAALTAKASGQPWASAIGAGLVAGLGSIGFHEIVQSFQAKPGDVVAKVVDAAAKGDAQAQAKVEGLSAQLDGIGHLPLAQQAQALATWAKANPPPASAG